MTMSIRVVDVDNSVELQKEWVANDNESGSLFFQRFSDEVLEHLPRAGDVFFLTTHYVVVNCVQNFDRDEIFIYVKQMLGFNPMTDQAYKYLNTK